MEKKELLEHLVFWLNTPTKFYVYLQADKKAGFTTEPPEVVNQPVLATFDNFYEANDFATKYNQNLL